MAERPLFGPAPTLKGSLTTEPARLTAVTGAADPASMLYSYEARGAASLSDMVAQMVGCQRLTTGDHRLSTGNLQCTRTKLVPRKGATLAWTSELSDILAARGRTFVVAEQRPPTLESFQLRLPSFPQEQIQAIHQAAFQQWWIESTDVYHIVRASLDLSGVYEEMELAMIQSNFCIGDWRDGAALLNWALS